MAGCNTLISDFNAVPPCDIKYTPKKWVLRFQPQYLEEVQKAILGVQIDMQKIQKLIAEGKAELKYE